MEKLKQKNEELEKDNREKETKYLDLYMENSSQHEQIVELQKQLISSGGSILHEVNVPCHSYNP